jgi:hypothetical protein
VASTALCDDSGSEVTGNSETTSESKAREHQ